MILLRLKTLLSNAHLTSAGSMKDSPKHDFSIFHSKICPLKKTFNNVELLNSQFKF